MKELVEKILKDLKSVKIDSREIKEGDIFFALRGEKTHGAYFVEDALKRGAKLAILPKEFENKFKNEKIIFVEDTLKFLIELAKERRKNLKGKIIAITGTVGKTTLKFMLSHIMNKNNKKNFPSPKSYNNFIGASLTLLNAPPETDYIIMEAGINKEGEMEELREIIKPDLGILTKIGPGHLEGLKSIEKVVEEKSKLFEKLPPDGFLVVNKNSPYIHLIKTKANIVYYEVKEKNLKWDGKYFIYKNDFNFRINVPSFGMVENALSALKTSFLLKLNISEDIFDDFKFPELRMQLINYKDATIILDAYNANPLSMEDAIKTGTFFNKKEKFLFMGDMLELGEYSEFYHREIARILKAKNYNAVFTLGEYSRFTSEESEKLGLFSSHYTDKNKMKEKLKEILERNVLIVIKGSRKMEMEKILEGVINVP
ncbi:MAG: UDP-N-acetylmuramoyl-tripeptide--D-alanyl-D-alanine ligase [candidate division WOR-3 bacterium]